MLTLLLDTNKLGVVRWFKDPTYNLVYPCAPLQEFSPEIFRQQGVGFVRSHFDEFQIHTVTQKSCVPVFQGAEERSYLKKKLPINISRNYQTGELTLSPLRFRKYSLGALQVMDVECCRKLAPGFTDAQFLEAFDGVLAVLG